MFGEPADSEQFPSESRRRERRRFFLGRAAEAALEPPQIEAMLGGALAPGGALVAVEGELLGTAGVQGGDLGGTGGVLASAGHRLEDLVAALGEVLDRRPRDSANVRGPVDDGFPVEPEAAGELVAQDGLVEVPGGLGVGVDQPAVERGPAIVRPLRCVRDHDVRVKQRVSGA